MNNKNNFLNQYQTTHLFVDFLKAYYCCNQFLDKKFACAYLHAPFNIIFISNFLPSLQVLASLLNAQLASFCCCSFSVLKNKLLLCRHYAHLCLTTTRRYIFELFLFRLLWLFWEMRRTGMMGEGRELFGKIVVNVIKLVLDKIQWSQILRNQKSMFGCIELHIAK